MSIFDHLFSQMGGAGFEQHMHGGHEEDEEDEDASNKTKYYEILEIEKSATEDEIKKAYKKKARKLHPDRHPNEREKYNELFSDLQKAYEVLIDPQKRELYDRYGEKGLKRGGGGSGMDDIISQFFDGGSSRRQKRSTGRKKSPALKKVVNCTLEDLYKGSIKKISITRYTAKSENAECAKCHGSGTVTVIQRMGPMMLQQRTRCPHCNGQGYELSTEDAKVDLHIPPGGRHRETVTIQGEGHQYPSHDPGDIIVQINQVKHDIFKRQGADLGMTHTLTLKQALCGYRIKVQHVSGHMLIIKSPSEGEIVQPGSLKRVLNYGMPIRFQAHSRGHLYVAMEIEFPKPNSLAPKAINQFAKLLPDRKEDEEEDDEEETKENMKRQQNKSKSKNKDSESKNENKNNNSNDNNGEEDEEDDDEDWEEVVEADDVLDGRPKATPASAKSYHDEDDAHQNVQCKQM